MNIPNFIWLLNNISETSELTDRYEYKKESTENDSYYR
jgi:hypothetical protein